MQYNFNFIVIRRNVIPFYPRQFKTILSSNSHCLKVLLGLLKNDLILCCYKTVLGHSKCYSSLQWWSSSFNSILVHHPPKKIPKQNRKLPHPQKTLSSPHNNIGLDFSNKALFLNHIPRLQVFELLFLQSSIKVLKFLKHRNQTPC